MARCVFSPFILSQEKDIRFLLSRGNKTCNWKYKTSLRPARAEPGLTMQKYCRCWFTFFNVRLSSAFLFVPGQFFVQPVGFVLHCLEIFFWVHFLLSSFVIHTFTVHLWVPGVFLSASWMLCAQTWPPQGFPVFCKNTLQSASLNTFLFKLLDKESYCVLLKHLISI